MALLPQGDKLHGVPEGLHMVPLPYSDDIRYPEQEPTMAAAASTAMVATTAEQVGGVGDFEAGVGNRAGEMLLHLARLNGPPPALGGTGLGWQEKDLFMLEGQLVLGGIRP